MCGCQGPCTCQLTSAERWSRLSFSACLPGRTAVSLLGPQQTCSSWHIIPSWLIVPVSFYQPAISTSSKFTSLTTSLRLNFVTAFPPSLYPPLSASLPSPSLLGRSISVSPLPLLPLRYASILIFVISAFSHPPYLPSHRGPLATVTWEHVVGLWWNNSSLIGDRRKNNRGGKTGINQRVDWPTAD